jgi:hypothetical protein
MRRLPRSYTSAVAAVSSGTLPLEFRILTVVRTEATIGAKWGEVDWKNRIWTVPPERNKGKKGECVAHKVPLSSAALSVLLWLPFESWANANKEIACLDLYADATVEAKVFV